MNIKQSLVLFSSLFFSFSAMSASKWLGDWFEIEVILISQLDNKAKLKEAFSEQDFSLDYSNALDLLSPYLNPDIATLKQQLPLCNELNDERNYLEQATIWPTFHFNKSLATLSDEQLAELALLQQLQQQAAESSDDIIHEQNQLTISERENTQTSESLHDKQIPAQPGDNDDFFDRVKTKQEQIKASLANDRSESGLRLSTDDATANNPDTFDSNLIEQQPLDNDQTLLDEKLLNEVMLTEEQKVLVLEAEQAFSDIQFIYGSTFPTHYQSLDTNKALSSLCAISHNQYEQLNVDNNLYSYNGFLINKVPNTINNVESIFSDVPYLISEDSLQLKSIVKQLRRSKDFRPLLHLAWRQPVFEKENSQPVKIFAGDNVQGKFAKDLVAYQTERNAERLEEQALKNIFNLSEYVEKDENAEHDDDVKTSSNESLTTQAISEQVISEQAILEQVKAQKVNEILQQISNINNVEEVVASIGSTPQRLGAIPSFSSVSAEPTPPVQPWYVEGLMEVYLIGNYLHVANDFSILNMTLAEQESLKLKTSMVGNKANDGEVINIPKVIPIRMTQDRRMISREVHYFDHPYMGIIVQIRRHQRPELPLNDNENFNSDSHQ